MRRHTSALTKARLEDLNDHLNCSLRAERERTNRLETQIEATRRRLLELEAENGALRTHSEALLSEAKRLRIEVIELTRRISRLS